MLICNVKLLTKEEIANKMQWASMTDALDNPRVWPGLARGSGVTESWDGTTAYELLGDGWISVASSKMTSGWVGIWRKVPTGHTSMCTWAPSPWRTQLGGLHQEVRTCPLTLLDPSSSFTRGLSYLWGSLALLLVVP